MAEIPDEPVEIPVDGVLDLHSFAPRDIPDLIAEYIMECLKRGIHDLRIIHGKGKGVQRERVRRILQGNPHVARFQTAPPQAGGWGATTVTLKRRL